MWAQGWTTCALLERLGQEGKPHKCGREERKVIEMFFSDGGV